ncbi:hypothetical protein SAMN05444166_2601 [Singulisphaera sp. GP187]|uniref:hypothetical protein n=1 Tax=Singulisphaera sp. GP187 TaxID=1882752 RepID=UPI000925EE42|nr:hypothetical protein [Singulisphaera sp. GP187]SIO12812.1 hypothetical protein SAMN05444166_2601 [Singulisphaera sp. GP187]
MHTPKRAAFRLALAGWVGLAGLSLVAAQSRAATPPEKVYPDSTIAFLKVNDATALRESFKQSQFGQLWNDTGLKSWREDFAERLNEAGKSLKAKIGVTYQELLQLPQGPVSIAVVRREDPKLPVAILITADAGKNTSKLNEVLAKATQQSEQAGSKVATETFKGATLHVIQPPPSKDKPKDDAKDDRPEPPVVWTNQGTVFIIGSDVDATKDLLANAEGRTNSLESVDSYAQTQKKIGADAQVSWFVDLAKVIKLAAQGAAAQNKGNAAQTQQVEAIIQMTGLNGLKAAAGSFTLNKGNFDSLTKTYVYAPGAPQGLLKIFSLPRVNLRPESWVPATVASYQTWSWDLDNAYTAINDVVNMIQPGMLQVLEQQLVGPNGGEPLKFQNDIFGPLGDRITLISDFKKPIKEDNQRMVLGVALEDAKAFQSTLNKLIGIAGGAPKKREFQGTTIYDFEIPDVPNNANLGNARQFKGPISVAVAKNTVFVSSEPTLLELVLRGGGPSLADSPDYQAVAKEIPEKASTLSFVRPEEQARLSYDMVKSGQFEKALQGSAVAGGPDLGNIGKLIDKDKLPDFSIFAKYLSQGGSYGVQEEDGFSVTGFSLRKANP